MKKLLVIFAGAAMALASCQSPNGLASSNDDVYYNPAKERKPNVPPQPEQYNPPAQQNPNAGKIGATAADQNNPYYKDPSFNYDDYYDNAYAARIRRFNNPIYGTGYYDSYNTNSYFYNGNPNYYGTSIYSSYNMGYNSSPYYAGSYYPNNGWGNYYSPSTSFWSSYYNPYYSGMGMGMGYGMGYGSSMYGGYGYNPYSMYSMGYGCGGYNPYMYGMGYSPYGYSPYGYGYGYGMGMGYGSYNPMTNYGGYYNSYDYNSNSYTHFGPRGTHAGGNSTVVVDPHHREVKTPDFQGPAGTTPYTMDRFSQVNIPQEHFNKIVEARNPVMTSINSPMYQSPASSGAGGGRPIYNNGGGYSGDGRPVHYGGGNNNSNGYNGGLYNGGTAASPTYNSGGGRTTMENNGGEVKPHRWFSGTESSGSVNNNNWNSGGSNNNWNSGGSNNSWNSGGGGRGSFGGGGGSFGGGGGGGSFGGGGGGGRPRK